MHFGTYKATRNAKGHLVIENVPIFVECKRGETNFSDEWIAAAVRKAKQAELEGYMPPLHIRHHEAGADVASAGYFRIRGASVITFKGKTRTAVFADLVVTHPGVELDVLAARLPYRSVEIFDVDDPAINSLALLDHEPPYLELPMLMVDEPAEMPRAEGELAVPTSGTLVRVADATFRNPWQAEGYAKGEQVVACFRRGHSAHLFLEDTDSMSVKKNTTPAAKPTHKAAKFADDKEPEEKMADDEKDGEDMAEGEGGLDVDAVCSAISDGSITVAQMEQIKAAIVAQMSEVGAEEEEPEEAPAAAPAPTPGEAMKNTPKTSAQFAALHGKIDAQAAKIEAMEREASRKVAVADALTRLEGRALGSDPEAKFAKRFDELGAEGFKLYVDDFAATFGVLSGADGKASAFASQSRNIPEAALAYTEQGTEAVEKATKFAAEHTELSDHRLTRTSVDAYVRSNMTRAGFKAAPAAK